LSLYIALNRMSISRFLTTLVAIALGAVLGCFSFVAIIFAERDRGSMNEVFAAGLGVGYLLPTVGLALVATVLATVLLAQYSVSLARIFGLSGVAVLGILLVLAALLTSYGTFAALGVAVAVTGAILVLTAVKAMQRGAI
jgi:hypothetical protein